MQIMIKTDEYFGHSKLESVRRYILKTVDCGKYGQGILADLSKQK